MKHGNQQLGKHTLAEIRSQADSWDAVFMRIDRDGENFKDIFNRAEEILFAGCGSAFNISHAVAPFFQLLSGKTCRAVHSSDLLIFPDEFISRSRKTMVIMYSRSGDTTESVMALEKAKHSGAFVLSVVCFSKSRMAAEAHVALVLEEAVEKSVTTTRSLTSMVLAGYYLAGVCTGNDSACQELKKLPDIARGKMASFEETGRKIGRDQGINKYAFVGSGSYYGLAREAQLKVKEMVLLPSDSYVSLDYQHGPMSNVDPHMLVTVMVSDAGRSYDLTLARNMKNLGGKVFVLCDRGGQEFHGYTDYIVELNSGLGDGIRNILYMPAIQFMAYYRSLLEGQDPDNPKNLDYYIDLNR
jgi:glucosamine--fructose-6-phosphate aminotransferase (isomerizing)